MWAQMGDDELLAKSELIVVGEWVGQTRVGLAGAAGRVELGALSVAQVLKGAQGLTLVLVATSALSGIRSSTDITFRRGDRGMWLLRPKPGDEGVYLADHPQRFVSSDKDAARIESLRRMLARK